MIDNDKSKGVKRTLIWGQLSAITAMVGPPTCRRDAPVGLGECQSIENLGYNLAVWQARRCLKEKSTHIASPKAADLELPGGFFSSGHGD